MIKIRNIWILAVFFLGAFLTGCSWFGFGDIEPEMDPNVVQAEPKDLTEERRPEVKLAKAEPISEYVASVSPWIEIESGGLGALPKQGPFLFLDLKNKADKPIWVTVNFSTPGMDHTCAVTKKLEAGETDIYACPQASISVNKDYPASIKIYEDESGKKMVDNRQTLFWFSTEDAQTFDSLKEKYELQINW